MKSSTATAIVESPLLTSRRQPVRQTRTNPSRNATNTSRSFGGRVALDESQVEMVQRDNAPGFYPAITHFTDSIDALPKEMIRNYTMLKEVDAKIFGPEEALRQMVSAALKSPTPARKDYESRKTMDGQPYHGRISNAGAAVSINGTDTVTGASQSTTNPQIEAPTNVDLVDLPRRKLFFHLRMLAGEMLATLDEKNHVLSVAADTLDRQLARCESSYPYINNEISEETRYGNLSHWAYMDKTADKKGTTANERTRRETAAGNGLTVGSIQEGELAAMRSEARREALAAKKRAQPVDSDFDDNRAAKKTNTGKGKKVIDTNSTSTMVGLGIINGSSSGAIAVPNKRRKIEKSVAVPVVESLAMERSLSAAYGSTIVNSRGGGASPRDTPTTENPKKRVRTSTITNGNGSINRRQRAGTNASAINSPAMASSPVVGTFSTAIKPGNSPALGTMQRSQSTRGRQNSTQAALADHNRKRPPSSASNRQTNGTVPHGAPNDLPPSKSSTADSRVTSKDVSSSKVSDTTLDSETRATRTHDRPPKGEGVPIAAPRSRPPSISTSRSGGKASKTNTPLVSSFPEPVRPRSSRTTQEPMFKRSHKKGAGLQAQLAAAKAAQGEEDGSSGPEDGGNEGEPKYCYCNGVSYGEMVACDYEGCAKEWFHLACAGLARAPVGKSKWYCTECEKKVRHL